jgi:cystathionine beta-synthase
MRDTAATAAAPRAAGPMRRTRVRTIRGMATPEIRTGEDIRDSILDTVGETPLVRLSRIGAGLVPELVAKVESFNPGGSIKDRVAVRLVDAAERDGLLRPGGTIIEPTSGNTGTGLAIAARLKGYRVIAVMPDKMSREKIDLLRAYGAEVVVTPTDVSPDSPQSYYRVADRLTEEIAGAYQPNQYANPANPQTHYDVTGPELWRQSGGRVTHLVVGVGTGGTITGMGRYLKERNPAIEVIGADPVGSIYSNQEVRPYLVEGVGEDFWPQTYDPSVVDRYVTVSDRDSFLTTRRLAGEEALLVGGSCGLAVHAALQVAAEITDPAAMVAVVLPDGGRAYLSKIFNDGWMTQYGFLDRAGDRTVGDVLRDKTVAGEIPPFVTVQTHQRVREAIALLHEHRVSQLPVVSSTDESSVVGSVGERGLLKRAMDGPQLMAAEIAEVMEPAFPAVSTEDPVREAVELLAGEGQALTVTQDGRPVGIVTRADLLESLVS